MNIYLDTSAFNWLLDDPNSAHLQECVVQKCRLYLSIFTFAELASESCAERRIELIRLAKKLSGGFRPAAMPGDLLRRSKDAIINRRSDMDNSMGTEWNGIWAALNNPDLIDEMALAEIQAWKTNQEKWYCEMFDSARPPIQEALRGLRPGQIEAICHSFAEFMRLFGSVPAIVGNFFHDIASKLSSEPITRAMTGDLIRHSEHWRFFYGAVGYGLWARTYKLKNYGKKSSPGSIDTQQAIYISICDCFVTADSGQYDMLRLVKQFGHKKRIIWKYDRFRDVICD